MRFKSARRFCLNDGSSYYPSPWYASCFRRSAPAVWCCAGTIAGGTQLERGTATLNTSTTPEVVKSGMHLGVLADERDCLHLQCAGEIILPEFQPAQDPLLPFLGEARYSRRILLNLERATMLDTSGVTWLVCVHSSCKGAGGVLVLHSIPPRVAMVLKLLHLNDVLITAADAAAARERARKEAP